MLTTGTSLSQSQPPPVRLDLQPRIFQFLIFLEVEIPKHLLKTQARLPHRRPCAGVGAPCSERTRASQGRKAPVRSPSPEHLFGGEIIAAAQDCMEVHVTAWFRGSWFSDKGEVLRHAGGSLTGNEDVDLGTMSFRQDMHSLLSLILRG